MGMGMDRMSSTFDRMGPTMGTGLDRNIEMDRGFVPGPMGSGVRDRVGSKGNQIFVRNVSISIKTDSSIILLLFHLYVTLCLSSLQLPFDLTWQKLKEKFSQCGKY